MNVSRDFKKFANQGDPFQIRVAGQELVCWMRKLVLLLWCIINLKALYKSYSFSSFFSSHNRDANLFRNGLNPAHVSLQGWTNNHFEPFATLG